MPSLSQHPRPILRTFRPIPQSALVLICVLALLGAAAEAQTYTVLHNFTGGQDGGSPYASVTLDRAGKLYGTTP